MAPEDNWREDVDEIREAYHEGLKKAAEIVSGLAATHYQNYLDHYDVGLFHLANLDKMAQTRLEEAAAAIRRELK
jgi:hypothetical protein